MAVKQWSMNEISQEQSKILSEEYGIPSIVADILVGRGITSPFAVEDFLAGNADFTDPFVIADMDKAVNRIMDAVENGERIAVYGDYDCDGVTATAILYQYFLSIGADACYYIPERDKEGYGLNREAVESLHQQGVTLLVTVDNGISAVDEVRFAKRLGIDVVITDHHQPSDVLPEAAAVVDPQRKDCSSEYKSYCGAGIALKLVAALEDGNMESAVEYFGDLAAIGTIGDIVPLNGENRLLVQRGLQLIENSENLGLRALLEKTGLNARAITAENIAFGIVPRINAAGRMGSAKLALELLLTEDGEQAFALADQLNGLNQERQQTEAVIIQDIEHQLEAHPEKLNERVLVLAGEGWHHGVIGIVSARILERFSKPNILISIEGDEARGSARSCGEFSLFKALSACSEYLTKFGGHKQAAGLSLYTNQIEAFAQAVNHYAKETSEEMPKLTCFFDRKLKAKEMTVENIEQLALLQPFGAENQAPLFLVQNAVIKGVMPLSNDKHIKLSCLDEAGDAFQVLYFGMSSSQFGYNVGDRIDLAVSADIHVYHGQKSVSIKLRDIRPSGFEQEKFFTAKDVYEKLCRGEQIDPRLKCRVLPTREEIGFLYQILRKMNGFHQDVEKLYFKIMATKLNYCKFRFILDILHELGLIELSPLGNDIKMSDKQMKVDLNTSSVLHKLQSIGR